jgi:predicted AlkP superfamily pyrophosphatase or phosphodiesterase
MTTKNSEGKIIIMGVDALEFDLVKKWDMKEYKQKKYDKIDVPILEKHGHPVTAVVWPCFITGKNPEEIGITRFEEWKNPFIPILDNLATKIGIGLGHRKQAGDFLQKLGLRKSTPGKERYENTIFDSFEQSKAISIPSYNEEEKTTKIRRDVVKALDGELEKENVAEEILEIDKERTQELIEGIKQENKLVMAHLFSLDVIQHLYSTNKFVKKHYYEEMIDLIEEVKENLNDEDLLLIISDHGQEKGEHTDHGFYSLNKKLDWEVSDIREVKQKIELVK